MELFKKGDKVIVTLDAHSDSTNSRKINTMEGVYNIPDWRSKIFTIEGTVQLYNDNENYKKDLFCSYALSLDGKIVGYVYNNALKLAPKVFYPTEIWDSTEWRDVSHLGSITFENPVVHINKMVDGVYYVLWMDGVKAIYKGEFK